MVTLWGEKGGCGEVHVVSALFALWGAMMVSKTLRVGPSSLSQRKTNTMP